MSSRFRQIWLYPWQMCLCPSLAYLVRELTVFQSLLKAFSKPFHLGNSHDSRPMQGCWDNGLARGSKALSTAWRVAGVCHWTASSMKTSTELLSPCSGCTAHGQVLSRSTIKNYYMTCCSLSLYLSIFEGYRRLCQPRSRRGLPPFPTNSSENSGSGYLAIVCGTHILLLEIDLSRSLVFLFPLTWIGLQKFLFNWCKYRDSTHWRGEEDSVWRH